MILNKGTRLFQPQGSAEIDYANSLAKGMAWLYLPSVEKELVRSLPITKGSGYTRRSVAGGVGQVLDANSSITTPSASLNSSDTLTMFSVASVKASLVSQAAIVPHAGSGSGSAGSTVVGQTGYAGGGGAGAVVYYSPNYNGYIIASSPGGDFTPGNVVVIVATYRRNDALRVYANGNLRATTAAADYQANLKFNSTVNVGGPLVSSTNVLMSGISYRAWSDAEILEFSANPWQLFKPSQRRVYFDMGAGGGDVVLTGSNASQVNTSSSGAITQTHVLSGANCSQSNTTTTGSVAQNHVLTGSTCAQSHTSTSGAISQDAILTGENCSQSNTSTSGSIAQLHVLSGASCDQSNTTTSGAISVTNAVVLTGSNCSQANITTTGAIGQTHVLVGEPVAIDNIATSSAIVQHHILTGSNCIQENTSTSGSINQAVLPSQFVSIVPAGVFSASVPVGDFSATVPEGNYRASI